MQTFEVALWLASTDAFSSNLRDHVTDQILNFHGRVVVVRVDLLSFVYLLSGKHLTIISLITDLGISSSDTQKVSPSITITMSPLRAVLYGVSLSSVSPFSACIAEAT